MKIFRDLVLLLGMLLIASAVQARSTVAVVERDNVPIVTGSGKPADIQTIKKTIVVAGLAGIRKWEIAPAADGKTLQGTFSWNNNKHSIMVRIEPTTTQYSVHYLDSTNMKYEVLNGKPMIHPFYNKYVEDLVNAIRVEMLKL
jgi:hypothetical protein